MKVFIYINPVHVNRLAEEQLRKRTLYLTLVKGLAPTGGLKILPLASPNAFQPRYFLEEEFSELFDPELQKEELKNAIASWQEKHFSLQTREIFKCIDEAIENLPEEQRRIFILTRYRNLSRKEAASALGMSVHTLNKRLHSAIHSLRLQADFGNLTEISFYR